MTRKNFILAILLIGLFHFVQQDAIAQGAKKVIERPSKCDVKDIDEFVSKTFDSYDESVKITDDINLIKVEGDGKTTPAVIKNGKGEELSKDAALAQMMDLLNRSKKQNENIKALQDLQKPATESLKKCSLTQKAKATKALTKGGEALKELGNQTKAQIELIEKQIEYIKTLKTSK
jgi:hypothetical protein